MAKRKRKEKVFKVCRGKSKSGKLKARRGKNPKGCATKAKKVMAFTVRGAKRKWGHGRHKK